MDHARFILCRAYGDNDIGLLDILPIAKARGFTALAIKMMFGG